MANGRVHQRSASSPALRAAPRDDGEPHVIPLTPVRRRPSAISLEKHGNLIFDEINSLLEGEDNDSCDSFNGGRGRGGGADNDDVIDREIEVMSRASELFLDTDNSSFNPAEAPAGSVTLRRQRSIGAQPRPQASPSFAPPTSLPRRSQSLPLPASPRTASNVLFRLERQVIDKGIQEGKLVRTSSRVSFRGSAIRRTMSVTVIREDQELSHEDIPVMVGPTLMRGSTWGGRELEEVRVVRGRDNDDDGSDDDSFDGSDNGLFF